jgi:hypothetical protein
MSMQNLSPLSGTLTIDGSPNTQPFPEVPKNSSHRSRVGSLSESRGSARACSFEIPRGSALGEHVQSNCCYPDGRRSSAFTAIVKLIGTRLGLKQTLSSHAWYSSAPLSVAAVMAPSNF